jgi:hypothetical protein
MTRLDPGAAFGRKAYGAGSSLCRFNLDRAYLPRGVLSGRKRQELRRLRVERLRELADDCQTSVKRAFLKMPAVAYRARRVK